MSSSSDVPILLLTQANMWIGHRETSDTSSKSFFSLNELIYLFIHEPTFTQTHDFELVLFVQVQNHEK